MAEAIDPAPGAGSAAAAPSPAPARTSRARTIMLLVLVLACFGAGFWGGYRLTSGEADPEAAVAEVAEVPKPVAKDLGRFAISIPGTAEPRVVKISASILEKDAPGGEAALRDAVHAMIVAAVEMPLVSAEAVTNDGITWAVMAIAPQEAPWLEAITLTDIQAMPG